MVSIEEVYHVSRLAKLMITDEEAQRFRKEFEEILSYFDILDEIDESIPPTFHVLEISNIFREDVAKKGLEQSEALLNSPRKEEGYFVGPKVVE
ncbi:MAG: Asp-tRNA(Asn)/Glu-tRNA(Gln) amidotransferase subunit GatC [Archaeoglobales archaeon]|jgi:aspartyl-tRNA(Asn)/glutamyl-tRNA(Gln) amidotransferase subunit C|nr:Asp-tRNA(Asn)/Glu-tRNA(Gln) amidotransferase subunit GatC [Archaeoglobus sp.]NHW89412.1 Asp-tRNA(Asn)/Glu-tRNA(Gln) amidotransferase subunit GatC [Archaeoglobales archaeon]